MLAAGCMERKTVVFLPLVATSQKFARILNDKGFAAREVNGEQRPPQTYWIGSKSRTRVDSVQLNAAHRRLGLPKRGLRVVWHCAQPKYVVSIVLTKTEVLAKGGWKKDVAIGEDVFLAFDPETQEAKYVPTIAKVRRKLNRDEFFCSIKGQSSDIRVTNNHRMLYDNKRRKG